MEPLTPEDALRLQVLLANQPLAIRIDESAMVVHGLTGAGEASVPLNPNCRDEPYLRRVREMISGQVLGSPGGYPVYLKRWTRMGQARSESLDQLLLLGEPEAVVAVVHAEGLSHEQARRAWWAMPSAENARQMLRRGNVASGELGPILAEYLVEYLPFEEEPAAMIQSVTMGLQPGLLGPAVVERLWAAARRKTAYYVGFLIARPRDLPERREARPDLETYRPRLEALATSGNPYAGQLLDVLSGAGQTYLEVVERVLDRPANQDVVNALFETVAESYASVRGDEADPEASLEVLEADAERLCAGAADCPAELRAVLAALPELRDELRALLVLARLGYPVLRPIFSRTTAIGSLMRRKLEPVSGPILAALAVLRGRAGSAVVRGV